MGKKQKTEALSLLHSKSTLMTMFPLADPPSQDGCSGNRQFTRPFQALHSTVSTLSQE